MQTQMKTPLTEEHVRFFREQGYVVVPDALSAEELSRIRAAVDDASERRFDSQHDGTGRDPRYDAVFHQKCNLWQVHEGIREYTLSPKIAEMARTLLGVDGVRVFHDQTLVKQPGGAKPTPFHQDLSYWPIEENLAITSWTALDDVNEQNSCLLYVPKSHTWGRFGFNDFTTPRSVAEMVRDFAPQYDKDVEIVPIPCSAGSVLFHHGLTFHGSTPNVTDRARRAMVIHYMADGVHYTGLDHFATNLANLSVGDPLTDDALFPLTAHV
jgi:ectoine hydroxylase-related dioxygenase (phytanoyl-CoA dioxygenase family)